jgi:predicted transcriptional regulator
MVIWMSKRTKIEIMVEILKIATHGVNKTRIVYDANLNFRVADRYIDELKKLGYLKSQSREGRKIYMTTSEGLKFLEKFNKFK